MFWTIGGIRSTTRSTNYANKGILLKSGTVPSWRSFHNGRLHMPSALPNTTAHIPNTRVESKIELQTGNLNIIKNTWLLILRWLHQRSPGSVVICIRRLHNIHSQGLGQELTESAVRCVNFMFPFWRRSQRTAKAIRQHYYVYITPGYLPCFLFDEQIQSNRQVYKLFGRKLTERGT